MISSVRCFSKDKPESESCSVTFVTTVPLNINNGWFGLDFLQEKRTSVACLVGSGV